MWKSRAGATPSPPSLSCYNIGQLTVRLQYGLSEIFQEGEKGTELKGMWQDIRAKLETCEGVHCTPDGP